MARLSVWAATAAISLALSSNELAAQCAQSTNQHADCYSSKFKATKNSLIGWRFLKEKKFKEAIAAYTLAIQENPRDASNYNNRASAYDNSGDKRKAIEDYTKAIEFGPKDDLYLNNRAGVYLDLQEYRLAKTDLEKALTINPKAWIARTHLAKTLHKLGDLQASLDVVNAVFVKKPNDADFRIFRGELYRDMGRYAEAISDLRCSQIAPNSANCYILLADTLRLSGDLSKSASALDAAFKLLPNGSGVYRVRGEIKQDNRDFNGALLDYTKAVEFDPTNVLALLRRADTLVEMGQILEAMEGYDKAASVDMRSARELRFRREAQAKVDGFRQKILEHTIKSGVMIFFDYGMTDLVPSAQPLIENAVKALSQRLAKSITVIGYTDTAEFQTAPKIGNARAFSVRSALIRSGIDPDKISMRVGNPDELLVPTPAGTREPQNRRVWIKFDGGN